MGTSTLLLIKYGVQYIRTLLKFKLWARQRDIAASMDWKSSQQWSTSSTLATEVTGPDTLWFFFLWGYVKDNAYKPPLAQNVRELQDRIRAAVQTVDGNKLKRVWQELD